MHEICRCNFSFRNEGFGWSVQDVLWQLTLVSAEQISSRAPDPHAFMLMHIVLIFMSIEERAYPSFSNHTFRTSLWLFHFGKRKKGNVYFVLFSIHALPLKGKKKEESNFLSLWITFSAWISWKRIVPEWSKAEIAQARIGAALCLSFCCASPVYIALWWLPRKQM